MWLRRLRQFLHARMRKCCRNILNLILPPCQPPHNGEICAATYMASTRLGLRSQSWIGFPKTLSRDNSPPSHPWSEKVKARRTRRATHCRCRKWTQRSIFFPNFPLKVFDRHLWLRSEIFVSFPYFFFLIKKVHRTRKCSHKCNFISDYSVLSYRSACSESVCVTRRFIRAITLDVTEMDLLRKTCLALGMFCFFSRPLEENIWIFMR